MSGSTAQSLRWKLMAVVLCTTAAALLMSAAILLVYEVQSARKAWLTDLRTQADIVANATAAALVFGDRRAVDENLALLKLRPQITAAAIYRGNHELFTSYVQPWNADGDVPPQAGKLGELAQGGAVELFQPIRQSGERVGTVYLRARYDIAERVQDYLAILLGVMLASLAAAALISARMQRAITTPIRAVARVARDVLRQRDYSLRAPQTATHEVDALVDAFNDMLGEVARSTEALQRSNEQLSIEMAERRRAEQSLHDEARAKDEFLATLAHELRNPLAPLSNALELLRRMPADDPPARERALQIMERQLRQMVRLIDDLLDVSRIARGKPLLRTARAELQGVLRSAVEIATPLIEQRRHTLALALPGDSVWLEADATRLAQAFANLLNNAAKYTDAGGRITLSLHGDEEGVVVRVVDSGAGIAPEMQERIFDKFVQLEPAHERGKGGIGLGLTLARQIIELHGGRIAVRSAGVGHGSQFEVWLPRRERDDQPPALAAAPAAEPLQGPAQGARRRILVADDNVDFAISLRSVLESLGHEVTVAHDGRSALHLAATLQPELVFLDIGMPELNGYELAEQLRRLPATRGSVLVAITGWGQTRERERARACGIDHHLVKPVDVNALLPILASASDAARPLLHERQDKQGTSP